MRETVKERSQWPNDFSDFSKELQISIALIHIYIYICRIVQFNICYFCTVWFFIYNFPLSFVLKVIIFSVNKAFNIFSLSKSIYVEKFL